MENAVASEMPNFVDPWPKAVHGDYEEALQAAKLKPHSLHHASQLGAAGCSCCGKAFPFNGAATRVAQLGCDVEHGS